MRCRLRQSAQFCTDLRSSDSGCWGSGSAPGAGNDFGFLDSTEFPLSRHCCWILARPQLYPIPLYHRRSTSYRNSYRIDCENSARKLYNRAMTHCRARSLDWLDYYEWIAIVQVSSRMASINYCRNHSVPEGVIFDYMAVSWRYPR